MDCPNGHGEMEWARQYIETDSSGVMVEVWICAVCNYSESGIYSK